MIGISGALEPSFFAPANAFVTHQPRNALATNVAPFLMQSLMNPGTPVALPVLIKDFANLGANLLVFELSRTDRTFRPSVIPAPRDFENST